MNASDTLTCTLCTHKHAHALASTKGPVGGSAREGKYLVETITTAAAEVQGATAAR